MFQQFLRLRTGFALDFRYSLRAFLKRPAFTIAAVLTLILVIGVNTALFSTLYCLVFRHLPYPESNRLVVIWDANRLTGRDHMTVIGQTFPRLIADTSSFTHLAGFGGTSSREDMFAYRVWGTDQHIAQSGFTSQLPAVLGVVPLLGRTFNAEDEPDQLRTAVLGEVILSYNFWKEHFGASPEVIGKSLVLNEYGFQKAYTIIGVMPEGFDFPYPLVPDKPDVWIHLSYRTVGRFVPEHQFMVVARLKPGTSLQKAQAELDVVSRETEAQNPLAYRGEFMLVGSLESEVIRNARTILYVLVSVLAIVMLVGCANIGNLLLVRAVERRQEMAVRAALGASYSSLIRQSLVEAVLLALAGSILGLLFATWAIRGFLLIVPPSVYIPRIQEVPLNFKILLINALISMTAAILFSVLPTLRLLRPNFSHMTQLRGAPARSTRSILPRHGSMVLVSQVALTLVLVTGTMLLTKSMRKLVQENLHFEPEHLLSIEVSFSNATALSPGFDDRKLVLFREFQNTIGTIPGVKSVALLDSPLLQLDKNPSQFKANGGTEPIAHDYEPAEFHVVTPNYFNFMGAELVRGRGLSDTDTVASPKVALINEAMLQHYWPQTNPLGIGVAPLVKYGKDEFYTVVGVIRDPKRFGKGQASLPTVYVSYAQLPLPAVTVLVRAVRDPRQIASTIRKAAENILPGQMFVGPAKTGEELFSEANARSQLIMVLISAFSGLALLLAILGVYGLISYYTAQRTREIGIRIAFGAQRSDIFNLVVNQSVMLTGLGIVLGLIGAFIFARSITELLYEVGPTDWTAFGAATLTLLAVGVVAAWIPARRATHIEPVIALRQE